MGRPKKTTNEIIVQNEPVRQNPNVEYKYDKFGLIDWKAMIPMEYIVLNRNEYALDGKNVELFSDEEYEKEKAFAPDHKKMIKLGGFKYIARLRGFSSQEFSLVSSSEEEATVSCKIVFLPSEENRQGLIVSALAQASTKNVSGEYSKYLAVIASNRAFIRCVKEALNILILGQEEIPDTPVVVQAKPGSPLDLIKKKTQEKGLDISAVKVMLAENGVTIQDSWVNFESLPVPVILTTLKLIKTNYGDE